MRKVKLFLLCLTCISILCGCGKKEEELPIQEDVVETINMKVEEVMLLSLPTTLEELWSYTPEEFADYLPQCIPNYREYFKIEEDKELTIEDWTNLQEILSYQLFKEGKPSKNDYRKFKITNDVNDDYGTMREVIYRRYFRVLKDNLERPDLIIVDGGLGQINVAREVISSLGLSIPVAGLKKDDKHSTNVLLGLDPIEEIVIDKRSDLFLLLTKMQNEVHNFTINYHKDLRSKGALSSTLDNIDVIGEVRKNKLLKKYKFITKMKEASLEELEEILPRDIAISFKKFLEEYSSE